MESGSQVQGRGVPLNPLHLRSLWLIPLPLLYFYLPFLFHLFSEVDTLIFTSFPSQTIFLFPMNLKTIGWAEGCMQLRIIIHGDRAYSPTYIKITMFDLVWSKATSHLVLLTTLCYTLLYSCNGCVPYMYIFSLYVFLSIFKIKNITKKNNNACHKVGVIWGCFHSATCKLDRN